MHVFFLCFAFRCYVVVMLFCFVTNNVMISYLAFPLSRLYSLSKLYCVVNTPPRECHILGYLLFSPNSEIENPLRQQNHLTVMFIKCLSLKFDDWPKICPKTTPKLHQRGLFANHHFNTRLLEHWHHRFFKVSWPGGCRPPPPPRILKNFWLACLGQNKAEVHHQPHLPAEIYAFSKGKCRHAIRYCEGQG